MTIAVNNGVSTQKEITSQTDWYLVNLSSKTYVFDDQLSQFDYWGGGWRGGSNRFLRCIRSAFWNLLWFIDKQIMEEILTNQQIKSANILMD